MDTRLPISIRSRIRLVATAGAAGFIVGGLGVAGLATISDFRFASTQIFALSALVLGFAVLGWSGSILAGGSIETMQHHLASTNWTEADSRRAMARIGGFAAGAMVAVVAVTTVFA